MHRAKYALAVLAGPCLLAVAAARAGDRQAGEDYLERVTAYADAMIEHVRDVYGREKSPLFAEEADRKTMRMLEGEARKKVAAIRRGEWGIRSHDRMLGGANPHHCLNLYQVLYALSKVTGRKQYAAAADASLKYFFAHCQSAATGLFYWGEHAGWDLRADKPLAKRAGDIHEFYRPWVLWERSWKLAPGACRRFALGLWEHQIGDHARGDYSRHAKISAHGPGTNAPYARHGGFYIETWAVAYDRTRDKAFLKAIESVLTGLERARQHEDGYLVSGSKKRGGRRAYDLSLAVSLTDAATRVPADLAERMRKTAAANDKLFARKQAERRSPPSEGLWSNAYGGGPPAGKGNVCMLRYRQTRLDAYRQAVLRTAEAYRRRKVELGKPVWPGTMGSVILLMLNARELTGEAKYLDAAERFACKGVELFLAADGPLPKASHVHDHYEAVTNGDTLMMALLRLWQVRSKPGLKLDLVFTDR